MKYYNLLDVKKEKKELNESCACSGHTLLHYGCKCDKESQKERTRRSEYLDLYTFLYGRERALKILGV